MFKKSSRVLFVTLLLFVLAGATYAFAAANTVDATFAGDGSAGITGYVVTSVKYTLSTTDPSLIESVSFVLNNPATFVKASLVTNGSFFDCGLESGNEWSCTIDGNVSARNADLLRIVAVQ